MYILAFSLLIGFLLLHIWEKRRIINGMVLTAGIVLLVIAVLLQLYAFDNQIVTIVTSAILLLLLSLLPFFVIGIAIMLILNGTNMVKKRRTAPCQHVADASRLCGIDYCDRRFDDTARASRYVVRKYRSRAFDNHCLCHFLTRFLLAVDHYLSIQWTALE